MSASLSTVAGTLRDAKLLIEHEGWQSHKREWGHIDIHQAIVRSRGGRRVDALKTVLWLKKFRTSIDLLTWNDAYGRTRGQVFDLLDQAIEFAEGREGGKPNHLEGWAPSSRFPAAAQKI